LTLNLDNCEKYSVIAVIKHEIVGDSNPGKSLPIAASALDLLLPFSSIVLE